MTSIRSALSWVCFSLNFCIWQFLQTFLGPFEEKGCRCSCYHLVELKGSGCMQWCSTCNDTAMQPCREESLNEKIYLSQNNNSATMVLSWRVENFSSICVILCLMFVSCHSAINYVMTRTWCLKVLNNYNHQAAHLAVGLASSQIKQMSSIDAPLSRNKTNGYLTV